MTKVDRDLGKLWPFVAGAVAGAAGAVIVGAVASRRRLDPRLIRISREDPDLPPAVIVPGIMGSQLLRPDGTEAWLNLGNAFGHHDLRLPPLLPLSASRDALVPGGLVGVDTVLPRLFGFTEYADLLDLLETAGFTRDGRGRGAIHHVFTYDWRRDIVESARRLDETLTDLAEARGEPDARFTVVAHSMGGLVARYYLRFGTAEPDGPVTWAGARRLRSLVLVATPSAGSIPALDAVLNGNRVGLSSTTLSEDVVSSMPAIYALLPPAGTRPLVDERGCRLDVDLHDPATWERFGWGPFAGGAAHGDEREHASGAMRRAGAVHAALAREPRTACPVSVVALGGDCLPTPARARVAPDGSLRFEPHTREESELLYEAGDGRVARSSVLGSHLPRAAEDEHGCGLPEIRHAFFGDADHHGIYRDPTFQSVLLRTLLRPVRRTSRP